MRFIGGDSHGQPVPEADQAQHSLLVGRQRYVRHGEHFVIFGMAAWRVAELIAALQCGHCGGSGRIYVPVCNGDCCHDAEDCETCEGSGWAPAP